MRWGEGEGDERKGGGERRGSKEGEERKGKR